MKKENRSERLFVRIKPSVKQKLMEMAKEQSKSVADLIEEMITIENNSAQA